MNKKNLIMSSILIFLLILGCVSTPPFDQAEYDRAIALKVDALLLLENTTREFHLYQENVAKIKRDMLLMLEYAKNKPNNDECIALLERMNDPDGQYLGNILKEWEIRGAFSEAYAVGLTSVVSPRLDDIIELLGKRIRK